MTYKFHIHENSLRKETYDFTLIEKKNYLSRHHIWAVKHPDVESYFKISFLQNHYFKQTKLTNTGLRKRNIRTLRIVHCPLLKGSVILNMAGKLIGTSPCLNIAELDIHVGNRLGYHSYLSLKCASNKY